MFIKGNAILFNCISHAIQCVCMCAISEEHDASDSNVSTWNERAHDLFLTLN